MLNSSPCPNHEIKSCPRCNGSFECKVGNILECQCSQVQMTPATAAHLAKTHYDCLCANCLEELNQMTAQAAGKSFPKRGNEFVEGVHFYREGGYWIFTEYYHLLRGECCQSGCRHCAYGYEKPLESPVGES